MFILLRGATGGALMEYLPTVGLPLEADEIGEGSVETLPGRITFRGEGD